MTQHLDDAADRPTTKPTDEIEITPEMIAAGAEVVWTYFDEVTAFGSGLGVLVASEVFRAMMAKRAALPEVNLIEFGAFVVPNTPYIRVNDPAYERYRQWLLGSQDPPI